jgi:hypothetical protein
MIKVNNTFFMLDYHPFFSFSTHHGCDVRKKACDAPALLNCIYRAAKTNDSIACAKHPLCCSRTNVLLKILVSGRTRATCVISTRITSASSCFAKGTDRIYPGGAPGRNVACQHGDYKQKQRHDQKHKRIMRANSVEQTRHQGGGRC